MTRHKNLVIEIYTLAWPVIIGQLGHIGMSVVDNMMVGQLGANDLAAAALANNLFVLSMVVGLGVSFALSPLVSYAIGQRDSEGVSSLFSHGFWINISVGSVLVLLLWFFDMLIPYLNQPPVVVEKSRPYLLLLAFSLLPIMAFQSFKQYIEGFGIMRPAMIITLLANVVNYLGNKALIYGTWGFPAMGLNGAGVSTLLTRIFMVVFIAIFVGRLEELKPYNLTLKIKKFNSEISRKILTVGLGSGMQYFFEVGCFSFAIIMIGWLGAVPQAAHQIAINLASISYMVVLGISSAVAILIGRRYGAADWKMLKHTGNIGFLLGVGTMAVFGLAFAFWNHFWPTLYTPDSAVLEVAAKLLIIAAFFQVFDGAQAVGIGVLRGMADVKIPTLVTFIAYWIIGIPSAWLIGIYFSLGAVGVWIGLSLGLAFSAFMLYFRFRHLYRFLISK
jgi:MATE family multidrug resistance protein